MEIGERRGIELKESKIRESENGKSFNKREKGKMGEMETFRGRNLDFFSRRKNWNWKHVNYL